MRVILVPNEVSVMELPKDELQSALDHEQKMLKIRRRNLRALEEQEANYGGSCWFLGEGVGF